MKKFVIFNHCGTLAFTTLENYSRQIMNRGEIALCKNYESPEDIAEYFSEYLGLPIENFLILA